MRRHLKATHVYRWHSAFEQDFNAGGHGFESEGGRKFLQGIIIPLYNTGKKGQADPNAVAVATVKKSSKVGSL